MTKISSKWRYFRLSNAAPGNKPNIATNPVILWQFAFSQIVAHSSGACKSNYDDGAKEWWFYCKRYRNFSCYRPRRIAALLLRKYTDLLIYVAFDLEINENWGIDFLLVVDFGFLCSKLSHKVMSCATATGHLSSTSDNLNGWRGVKRGDMFSPVFT